VLFATAWTANVGTGTNAAYTNKENEKAADEKAHKIALKLNP
jgi:hypothetical protein